MQSGSEEVGRPSAGGVTFEPGVVDSLIDALTRLRQRGSSDKIELGDFRSLFNEQCVFEMLRLDLLSKITIRTQRYQLGRAAQRFGR